MVGRYVKMTAVPGKGDELAALLLEVAGSLRGTDGCALYAVNRTAGDPGAIWITELWRDQQAVDASLEVLQTDAGKGRLAEVMALLQGPPERIDLEPLGGVGLGTDGAVVYRRFDHDGVSDVVAIEEPLEIRVDGAPLAVTMRTPGHDEELALGFLYGEGLIDEPRPAGLTDDLANNTIEVRGPLLRDPGVRSFYTTSSCGVCGKGALEEVAVHSAPLPAGPVLARALAAELPSRLEQPTFERTGGVHATGLFDADGALLYTREDVGRHNAMDKVIGRALIDGRVPLGERVLCVSGRLSFELVQKACVAGAPILIGVGAPSSLAIELADDRGLTLCGFARRGTLNVYTRPERIA